MPIYAAATQSAATVTSTSASSVSVGTVTTIIVGCLFAGILFIVLALYFFHCSARHRFARVAKHADADVYIDATPDLRHLPTLSRWGTKVFTPHSKRYSMSKESLSSASRPRLPPKSRGLLYDSPTRLDVPLPTNGEERSSNSLEVSENTRIIPPETVAVPDQQPLEVSRSDLDHPLSHTGDTPGDDAVSASTLPISRQDVLVRQMLKSRAHALESIPPTRRHSSLESSQPHSPTLESPVARTDLERLLAEVERNARPDVEKAQWSDEEEELEEEDWGDAASVYSQASATFDHAVFFSVSRNGSLASLPRRKSSRRRPPADLPPVPEVPSHLRTCDAQPDPSVVSTGTTQPQEGQRSYKTAAQAIVDQYDASSIVTSETLVGSVSSKVGEGAPRRPPRTPRLDAGTDWTRPRSGLGGVVASNVSSHSMETSERPGVSAARYPAVPAPAKHAYPRDGTGNYMPDTRRRDGGRGGYTNVAL